MTDGGPDGGPDGVLEGVLDGDLVFWSINVPDVPQGQRFFAGLFGWDYSDPGPSGAVLITGRKAAFHPSGHRDPQTFSVCVHDIDRAVAAVREAGGSATDPVPMPYGAASTITAPGGVRMSLSYNATGHRPLVEPDQHGALVGWNLLTSDPAASARFFGDVFGWRTEDLTDDPAQGAAAGPTPGLSVVAAAPPCALLPTTLEEESPGSFVFRVDDLALATERVRSLGGSHGPVRTSRWGEWATGVDDQGTAFVLWGHEDPQPLIVML